MFLAGISNFIIIFQEGCIQTVDFPLTSENKKYFQRQKYNFLRFISLNLTEALL